MAPKMHLVTQPWASVSFLGYFKRKITNRRVAEACSSRRGKEVKLELLFGSTVPD